MRMLFLCFVVVLFISDNSANPIESVDIVEASGEKENSSINENDKSGEKSVENLAEKIVTEQLNSENEMPEEVIRSKKSNYPSAPYQSAPYPSAPYPSASYPSASYPIAPYPEAPCGCSNQYNQHSLTYGAPQISYGPSYSGYSGSVPGYSQPQYSRPKHGGRKGSSYLRPQSLYQSQPSYQSAPQPSYQSAQPSYQPQQPSYQAQASYQSPQVSYQSPQVSYQSPQPSYQPSQSAYQSNPSYSASSSYANQGYSAPGPSQSYAYPSPAPNVQCGSNLLFGCQPHVSQVPCSGFSPSYSGPHYGPPQQYSAPAYRNADEAEVSKSPNNQHTPDTEDKNNPKTKTSEPNNEASVSSILSAPTNHAIERGPSHENKNDASQQKDASVSATNELSPEDAKLKKYDTLMKMSEMAKTLAKDEKGIPQQNKFPSTNQQNAIGKSPLPGPQPTSVHVGMNSAAAAHNLDMNPVAHNQGMNLAAHNQGMNPAAAAHNQGMNPAAAHNQGMNPAAAHNQGMNPAAGAHNLGNTQFMQSWV